MSLALCTCGTVKCLLQGALMAYVSCRGCLSFAPDINFKEQTSTSSKNLVTQHATNVDEIDCELHLIPPPGFARRPVISYLLA